MTLKELKKHVRKYERKMKGLPVKCAERDRCMMFIAVGVILYFEGKK